MSTISITKPEESAVATVDMVLYILCAYGYTWLSGTVVLLLGMPVGIISLVASPGPFVGAVVVTIRRSGMIGVREFLVKIFHWRFSPVWYVAALLIPFAVITLSSGIAVMFKGAQVPDRWFIPEFGALFIVFFLICNGIGEEVGWRGFALPQLQQRFGSLAASIILGIIWALWHLPLFFIPGSYQYGDSLALYVLFLVFLSVIMTMLVNKTRGSVVVAIIFHETINFIAFTMNYPGIYNLHFYLLATLLALLLLPRPLIVDFAGDLAASMVQEADKGVY